MTNVFKIRRASPAYPPKSGCGVPPQAVREAPRPHSSSSFQRFSFQNFSFYLMPTLNDIAITQMRTLLNASSIKRLT